MFKVYFLHVAYIFTTTLYLFQVPDSAIKECRNYTDFSGKEFTNPLKNEEDRKHFPPVEIKG